MDYLVSVHIIVKLVHRIVELTITIEFIWLYHINLTGFFPPDCETANSLERLILSMIKKSISTMLP